MRLVKSGKYHLSTNGFRYDGKAYLHVMELSGGTGYEHTDEIFRIESGDLHPITMPQGLPPIILDDADLSTAIPPRGPRANGRP